MSSTAIEPQLTNLPSIPSPYEGTILSTAQHLKISAYWFATNFLWGALLTIMIPGEIRSMAPHYRVIALSLVTGLSAFVALVTPLVVGALSDRCASRFGRRRPFIVAGVGINLLGLVAMATVISLSKPIAGSERADGSLLLSLATLFTSPSYIMFLLAFAVVQFGNNVASAAYSGVIPDLVPEQQRGAASGYMALMSQLGTLCGAIGCGLAMNGSPEGAKYALVTAVLVLVASITVFGIKETPLPVRPPKIEWGPYVRSLWIDPKKYPDFAWVWITRALVMLGFYAIVPFINYYLVDVIGLAKPETQASLLIAILLLSSSISGIYGGYLSDRIGRKRVVYMANFIIAVMCLGFIVCRTMPEVMVVGVLFGLGFGAYTSVDWALGTDVLPSKNDAAKEMGVWHVAMTLPQTISSPIAGALISAFGMTVGTDEAHHEVVHYHIGGYSAVFLMASVCFALGAFLLKNVRGVK